MVEEITAISGGLKVRHEEYDVERLLAEEQQKLAYYAHGKKLWLQEIDRQNCGFINLTVNPNSKIDERGFAKLADILKSSFSKKASFYALYEDELYYIKEPSSVTKINYPEDNKDEIKKLFSGEKDKLDLGSEVTRQQMTDLTKQEILSDENTTRMKELIAKFPTEFATISDINASYSAMRCAATKILSDMNIPNSLSKGLKDILQSIETLESQKFNPKYYEEKIAQRNEVALHESTELMKLMALEKRE